MQKRLLVITCLIALPILITWILGSCRKQEPHSDLELLKQEVPAGFPSPHYKFEDNPLTKEGFELGRKLFYDGRLSVDNVHPCSSCHEQIAGFGTFEHDRSHGVHNSHTLRNAPVLFNLAWNTSFHWDAEFSTLIDEAVHPINGQTEMGETFDAVIEKLHADSEYRRLFKEVFRYPFIRPEFILKALAQFTGYLTSANSKYDRVMQGLETFLPNEASGYQLYKANCATCHPEPLFTDHSLRNIGLPVEPNLNDHGRMRITGKPTDSLRFKVPTLRNTFISSNYMHDGRFNTLAQCINHYRTGVQVSATLDPILTNGITLTNAQTADMLSFLRTLTDSAFLKDSRFTEPN